MSDEPDEPDGADGGTLVQGPWGGDSSYVPPPIPDFADTIPPPEDIPAAPPESRKKQQWNSRRSGCSASYGPGGGAASEGIADPATAPDSEDGENENGEYVQPRSLADRLGDWLEFRMHMVRTRHEGEAPFREAAIERKVALLEARTAQQVALTEQNGKLQQR